MDSFVKWKGTRGIMLAGKGRIKIQLLKKRMYRKKEDVNISKY